MKKKVIIGFYVILLVAATVITSVGFCFNATHIDRIELDKSNLRYNIGQLILYEGKQADPHYQYLSFDKSVSKKKRAAYKKTMSKIMADYTKNMRSNDDISYVTKNEKGALKEAHVPEQFHNKSLDMTLTYDQKGRISGKKYTSLYDEFDGDYINLYTSIGYNTTIGSDEITKLTAAIEQGKVSINNPSNMTITIQVPQKIVTNYMRYILNLSDQAESFIETAFLISGLIIILFMIIVPLKISETIEPLKTMKNWYFIANTLIIVLGIFFSGLIIRQFFAGLVTLYNGQSMSNTFLLGLSMKQPENTALIGLTFALPSIMIYFLVSVFGFGLKYILANIKTYFKDHTLIGAMIRYVKKQSDLLISETMDDPHNKAIVKLCALHLGIIIGLTMLLFMFYSVFYMYSYHAYRSLFIIWLIMMVIYGFIVMNTIVKKMLSIKQSYQRLVRQAQDLSRGEFVEVEEDLGIFNSLRDEMNHVKEGFEKAVEEEVKSTTMKTELISNVSHDLKTPLTCIKNYVILLKDAKTPEDTKEYTMQIENYTNRLSTLIEDLFEVSKVNSGNVTLHETSLDLLALLDQAVVENEEKLESKSLRVIKKADLEKAMCYLDGEKTYRILDNLLGNIAKYAMPQTRVYIDVTHDEDHVSMALKNISEAEMNFTSEEIVERFVRGDKSRHVAGSGLGLAIAKSFTEVQGGTFALAIDGDMFKVTLTFALEKPAMQDE